MAKPNLSLYMGRKIIAISQGDADYEWGIILEGNVVIRNYDEREIFGPPSSIVGLRLSALSQSLRDTTLHFTGMGAVKISVSLAPTKYSVHDPVHGGEVYPQWPEELEMSGIPSVEGGALSDKPENEDDWLLQEQRLKSELNQRRQQAAQEFLKDE